MVDSGSHNFCRKLQDLNPSTISIQSLSKWMLFNYKAAASLVRTWNKEFMNLKPERKLVFLYLANDVMQQSRKKGKDFLNEWQRVLPGVYYNIFKTCSAIPKTVTEAGRLCTIWQERGMFDGAFIEELKSALKGTFQPPPAGEDTTPASTPRHNRTQSGGSDGGSIPPAVTSLGETLVRLGEHFRESEKLSAQITALPAHYFQADSSEPPPNVNAEDVEMAIQMVGAERQVLEDCRKELQSAMGKVKELLTNQLQQATDNDAKLKENETKAAALAQLRERLGHANHLHFKPQGGAAPPPPLADSDDEDAEPGNKRQKLDDPTLA